MRWADVDPDTTELPAAQYGGLLSERTRLVAVTAAVRAGLVHYNDQADVDRLLAGLAELA